MGNETIKTLSLFFMTAILIAIFILTFLDFIPQVESNKQQIKKNKVNISKIVNYLNKGAKNARQNPKKK